MPEITSRDILDKEGSYITTTIYGNDAATGTNYQHFFMARHPIEIMRVSWCYRTKSSSSGAKFDVEILPSAVAKSSGNLVCECLVNGAANIVYTKKSTELGSNRIVKEGERIGLVDWTLTGLVGLCVTIYYKQANWGSYR